MDRIGDKTGSLKVCLCLCTCTVCRLPFENVKKNTDRNKTKTTLNQPIFKKMSCCFFHVKKLEKAALSLRYPPYDSLLSFPRVARDIKLNAAKFPISSAGEHHCSSAVWECVSGTKLSHCLRNLLNSIVLQELNAICPFLTKVFV